MKPCALFVDNSVSKTNYGTGPLESGTALLKYVFSLMPGRSKEKTAVSECQAIPDLSIFQWCVCLCVWCGVCLYGVCLCGVFVWCVCVWCVFVDPCMNLNSEKSKFSTS